jgi:hypothetical protein
MKTKTVSKARIFLTAFCMLLLTFLSAQDSVRCIVIEKTFAGRVDPNVRPIIFIEGEKVYVRTQLAEKPVTGKLEFINDSVIHVDSATIAIHDIVEVGWWTNVLDSGRAPVGRVIGGVLLGVGTAGLLQLPFTLWTDDFATGIAGIAIAAYAVPVFITGTILFVASNSRHGKFHKKKLNETYNVRTETVLKTYAQKRKHSHW